MAEGREILTARLELLLGNLVASVQIAAKNNLTSANVAAETTLAGLLNRVYGWNLVNANAVQQNCPGIDLIDTERKIAVQVTSTRTEKKVRHTLEEVARSGASYDTLMILLVTADAPTPAMKALHPDIRNIPDVFRDAKELDVQALAGITEYLEGELGTIEREMGQVPRLRLPPPGALQTSGFVGREAELAGIRSRFERGDGTVVLTGLGGMGKTELAAQFGRNHTGPVYFVRFDTSLTRTLVQMALGIRPKLTEAELRLEESILVKRVLDLLEQSGAGSLLILDNVDDPAQLQKDPLFQNFEAFRIKVLMTTRAEVPRAIPVERMPDERLAEIFRSHGAELTEAEMAELIRAVRGHTLTVDLMARTLNGRGWRRVTAQMLLTALRDSSLRDQKYRKIATDYNESTEQAWIYEHLSAVFQVAGISGTCQQVMRCATLLPEGGMEGDCFGLSLAEAEQDALDLLLERGWLEMKENLLTIHPVVRLVCRTELAPGERDCEAFLERLWAQYDETDYCPDRHSQMAELFTLAHDRLHSRSGRWLNCAGILRNGLSQDQEMFDLYDARLPELERALPPDSPELAAACNYYGIALNALGKFASALDYGQKALDIRKEVLSQEDPFLAHSYNNVGSAYESLGDYRKALDYKTTALEILKKSLPPEHPDLAKSYIHVGIAYSDLGQHQKALEYVLKALEIWEKSLPPEHPDLASSYNSVGYVYSMLGQHQKALEYMLKALEIREKSLPPEHPDLAQSYNNVGVTHGRLGQHQKAREYAVKALEIREKSLPPEHPDLAQSYNNVGSTYGDLGQHQKALEYQQKALEILEKSLPPEHPDLATSYSSVGYDYSKLGQHQKALEYVLKALEIREKSLLPEHPDLASSYNSVGVTYGILGQHQKALEYERKALKILEKSLPPEHPDLAASYNNVGSTYGAIGQHQKDLEYELKALKILEKSLPPEHPHLALSCHNIACTYEALGDYQAAADYMARAAEIISRSDLPKTHPDRVKYSKRAAELAQKAKLQRLVLDQAKQLGMGSFPFGKK